MPVSDLRKAVNYKNNCLNVNSGNRIQAFWGKAGSSALPWGGPVLRQWWRACSSPSPSASGIPVRWRRSHSSYRGRRFPSHGCYLGVAAVGLGDLRHDTYIRIHLGPWIRIRIQRYKMKKKKKQSLTYNFFLCSIFI